MGALKVVILLVFNFVLCVSGSEIIVDFDNEVDAATRHSLELIESTNLARQELIQDVCARHPPKTSLDELPANHLEHILIDESHKLLYCYVPKVACTNWKRILMVLQGKWNDTDILSIPAGLAHSPGMFKNLSSVTKEERDFMLENYHKLIVARNPFERILSAYRNKLVGDAPSARYFQDRVGRRIIKTFRKNPTNESLEHGHDVTFEEFAQFLTDKSDELADVVKNEHWQPISSLCHPCLIKYTLIGKYETLLDDSDLALHTIKASHIQFPRLAHTQGTADKLTQYYSELPSPLIKKLYKLYRHDYKLFKYNLYNILGYY